MKCNRIRYFDFPWGLNNNTSTVILYGFKLYLVYSKHGIHNITIILYPQQSICSFILVHCPLSCYRFMLKTFASTYNYVLTGDCVDNEYNIMCDVQICIIYSLTFFE